MRHDTHLAFVVVSLLQAALIMQVLQLTPEQIAMLPPEQRQSILILKEQIQKTAGAPWRPPLPMVGLRRWYTRSEIGVFV